VLAAVLVPVSIASFGPRDAAVAKPLPVVVIKEAQAAGGRYKQIAEGDTVYLVNEQTGEQSILHKLYGKPQAAMERPAAQAVGNFGYLPGSLLIDPSSMEQAGIQPSIPFTYDATPEQSSIYLETLQADGWTIQGVYRTAIYLDYYLQKQELTARVIVLEDSMKVFGDVKPDLPDPRKFAAEAAP